MAKLYMLLSMPESFADKLRNLIKNINLINRESEGVVIEREYISDSEIAARPKKKKYQLPKGLIPDKEIAARPLSER